MRVPPAQIDRGRSVGKKEGLVDRLLVVRKNLGFSQKQMGEAIGSSISSWQDYEYGKSVPGGVALAKLAGMGIDINWLLTGEGKAVSEKAWCYSALTQEAENYILSLMEDAGRLKNQNAVELIRAWARGVFIGWDCLTSGWQKESDRARLESLLTAK